MFQEIYLFDKWGVEDGFCNTINNNIKLTDSMLRDPLYEPKEKGRYSGKTFEQDMYDAYGDIL